MAAICSSFAVAAANYRHSAYGFRQARIAYRWHPLFDRTLQVSRNRRGKDLTCIYTDERPDLARELPNWMFDESYCAGMTSGPPQVSIEALNELAAVLAGGGKSSERGSRSSPSETKEAIRAQEEEPRPIATRAGSRTPRSNAPNVKGLIEALADLLLEAMGERTTAPAARQGGGHEPQDHD
jgi:hypothetical protein